VYSREPTRGRLRTLVACLLVAVAVAAVAVGPAGAATAGGDGTAPPTTDRTAPTVADGSSSLSGGAVAAAANGSASLGDTSLTVTRGDEFNLSVSHSTDATLYLEGGGYLLRVNLTGSGSSTITVDTYNSTGPASGYVSGGDATVLSEYPAWTLAATDYTMNVTVDGVERDLGTLTIEPRSEMSAAPMVAPSSDSLSDAGAVVDAAEPGSTVAAGDNAVISIEESGLETSLNDSDLSGGAAAEGIEVEFVQREKPPNEDRHRVLATAGDDVTVLPRFGDDSVYVVWDTGNLSLDGARTYDVSVRLVGDHHDAVEKNRTVTTTSFTVEPVWFSLSADPGYTLHPWNGTNVSVLGRTNLAPGTEVELRTRRIDPTFLMTRTATVTDNGSFEAAFDYDPHGRGYEAPLWVLGHRDATEASVDVISANASVTVRDQVSQDVIVVEEATLGGGGFVSLTAGREEILGTTDYLEPGTHDSIRIELNESLTESTDVRAVAYMDRNRNRSYDAIWDPAYTSGNATVNDTARVTVPTGATTTTTPNATPTNATPANATPANATPANATPANATPASATPTPDPAAGLDFVVPTDVAVVSESPVTPSTDGGAPLSPGVAALSVVLAALLIRRL